jgi:flagellar protein FliO/FliZ
MNRGTPLLSSALLLLSSAALAQTPAAAPTSAGSLLQVLAGLVAVLGLMAGAAWVLKRFNGGRAGSNSVVRIVGGVSVGSRERVLVLEVGEQWIVVGVGAGRVNALATMARQQCADDVPTLTPATSAFPGWLKQIIERRNASQ